MNDVSFFSVCVQMDPQVRGSGLSCTSRTRCDHQTCSRRSYGPANLSLPFIRPGKSSQSGEGEYYHDIGMMTCVQKIFLAQRHEFYVNYE